MDEDRRAMNRRRFVECCAAAGVGSALFPGALAAVAQDAGAITADMLQAAQAIAGVAFTADEQRRLLEKLNGPQGYAAGFDRVRSAQLDATPPAIVFNPVLPGKTLPTGRTALRRQPLNVEMPASDEQLAFLPLTHLSRLVETHRVTATDLTKL